MPAINVRKFHCSVCKRPALIVCEGDKIKSNCSSCKKETEYVFGAPAVTVLSPSSAARPATNVVPKPSTPTT